MHDCAEFRCWAYGQATLILSGDVAFETLLASTFSHPPATARPCVRPPDEELKRLAALLQGQTCDAPMQRGLCVAHEQLLALAETLKSPIVHSLRGKEHI